MDLRPLLFAKSMADKPPGSRSVTAVPTRVTEEGNHGR